MQIEELNRRGHNAPTTAVADEFSPRPEASVVCRRESAATAFYSQINAPAGLETCTIYTAQHKYQTINRSQAFATNTSKSRMGAQRKTSYLERIFATSRYQQPKHNRAFTPQSINEFGVGRHCRPFPGKVRNKPNEESAYRRTYDSPAGHYRPSHEVFLDNPTGIHQALQSDALPREYVKLGKFLSTSTKVRKHESPHN